MGHPEAGARPPPLTAAVFGHPAHVGGQPVDVEVLPVEVSALLVPEILLQLRAGLGVAGLKFHSAPHAVFPTVFRPAGKKGREAGCTVPSGLHLLVPPALLSPLLLASRPCLGLHPIKLLHVGCGAAGRFCLIKSQNKTWK